jgi:hypothetical protein
MALIDLRDQRNYHVYGSLLVVIQLVVGLTRSFFPRYCSAGEALKLL